MTPHPRGTLFLLDTGTPGTSREDTAKMPRGKLELATRSGNRIFFPVVGRYFLIIFLIAITRILEGEETLKKSTPPQDNYWKSPIRMSLSVQSNLPAIVSHVKWFAVHAFREASVTDY